MKATEFDQRFDAGRTSATSSIGAPRAGSTRNLAGERRLPGVDGRLHGSKGQPARYLPASPDQGVDRRAAGTRDRLTQSGS